METLTKNSVENSTENTARQKVAESVLSMLERAEVIDIFGFLLYSWNLETLDCEDDEEVFSCNYTEDEGLIYEFSFSKQSLMEAKIFRNSIQMNDSTGDLVEISCYKMIPLE